MYGLLESVFSEGLFGLSYVALMCWAIAYMQHIIYATFHMCDMSYMRHFVRATFLYATFLYATYLYATFLYATFHTRDIIFATSAKSYARHIITSYMRHITYAAYHVLGDLTCATHHSR